MSDIPTRYELVFTPEAIAECLRTGARHHIVDGLPHDFGEEPRLTGARLDDDGKLRLFFCYGEPGENEKAPLLICKALTVHTIEELP